MRRSLHGLEVEVAGSLPAELVGELLGGIPAGDPALPADLRLVLEPARGSVPAGLLPLFYSGKMQAFLGREELWLTDGCSTARVSGDGRRILVGVGAGSLVAEERHRFQHLFLFTALLRALSARGIYHLHAAGLVADDGRTVLVVGTAGSGKTTLALSLIEAGLGFLGDDVVLLTERGGEPVVLSFPRPFHVDPGVLRPYPHLAPLLGERYAGGEKRDLDPRVAFPGRARAEGGPPAMILLPEVGSLASTELSPISAAEALSGLLDSSAFLAADEERILRARVALLAKLVNGAEALLVRLGRDALLRPGELANGLLKRRNGDQRTLRGRPSTLGD